MTKRKVEEVQPVVAPAPPVIETDDPIPVVPLTEGQWRVGTSFNPSGNQMVDLIKIVTARLIDALESIKPQVNDPRSIAKAQTDYEQAAMWAVKAITKGPR